MGRGQGNKQVIQREFHIPDTVKRHQGFNSKSQNGMTLVWPKASKWLWATPERPFRSLIHRDGRVLSVGFPKFFNAGEEGGAGDRKALTEVLQKGGEIWTEEKIDGTLVIRSVIDGDVVWRTRQTFDGGPMKDLIHRVVSEMCPHLNDPSIESDASLLFELTSPENQVVLKSDKTSLTFLDRVAHTNFSLLSSREEKENFALSLELTPAPTHPWPASLKELVNQVKQFEQKEGVVVRFADGQRLLKVKSDTYMKMHRLKTSFTVDRLVKLFEENKVKKVSDFEKWLKKNGSDWETLEDSRAICEAWVGAGERADGEFDDLADKVDQFFITSGGDRSKVIDEINSLEEATRQAALLLADGRESEAFKSLLRTRREEALNPWKEEM